jgi:hypothetical protein
VVSVPGLVKIKSMHSSLYWLSSSRHPTWGLSVLSVAACCHHTVVSLCRFAVQVVLWYLSAPDVGCATSHITANMLVLVAAC